MKILFSISFTVLALFSNAQFIKKLSLDVNVGGRLEEQYQILAIALFLVTQ